MGDERKTTEASIIFELHRLCLELIQLAHGHAAAAKLAGRDLEGLLMVWSAQREGEPIGVTELANKLGLTRAGATYLV